MRIEICMKAGNEHDYRLERQSTTARAYRIFLFVCSNIGVFKFWLQSVASKVCLHCTAYRPVFSHCRYIYVLCCGCI